MKRIRGLYFLLWVSGSHSCADGTYFSQVATAPHAGFEVLPQIVFLLGVQCIEGKPSDASTITAAGFHGLSPFTSGRALTSAFIARSLFNA
jgi:hypothetical protein